jgi:hypothetical protein
VRRRRRALGLLAAGLVATVLGAMGGTTLAAFTGQTDSPGNAITAASDFRAPTVDAAAIGKSSGGIVGFVKGAGGYYVYANVSDSGNPASGIAGVTANVSALTAGQTSVALTAGSYSAGGVSYNYRSAALTADPGTVAGSVAYSVATQDNASNSATSPFAVTVDNTGAQGSDVQTANVGSTAGQPQLSDTATLTFGEQMEPESILAGWSGSATNVVVHIDNTGTLGLGNDQLSVYNASNSAQLPLGTVDLGNANYVLTNTTFGATGTASTMTMSGSAITLQLGTASSALPAAVATNTTMSWTPAAGATDRAGNASSTAAVTESGAADKEF